MFGPSFRAILRMIPSFPVSQQTNKPLLFSQKPLYRNRVAGSVGPITIGLPRAQGFSETTGPEDFSAFLVVPWQNPAGPVPLSGSGGFFVGKNNNKALVLGDVPWSVTDAHSHIMI